MVEIPSPLILSPAGALVTGAGKRLGRAMALTLGQRGFNVAVHYNSSFGAAEAVAQDIRDAGGKATTVQADLSNESEIAALLGKAIGLVGPLNLLVNSASVFEDDGVATMTRDSWDKHLETNLRAPMKLTQDFAAQEFAPGTDRLVVNLIDQRVLKLTPQFLSYTLSKAALFTLTKTLAQALGPEGIRVNGIGPGPTMRNARQSEADWEAQNAGTILGHGATPDDICAALVYLMETRAVTGQMIAVDGGQHLAWQTPDALVNE